MKKTYIWNGTAFAEKKRTESKSHFVQPDIVEFKGADGVTIGGRRQWREHLKETGTIEMGLADMQQSREKWNSRQNDFKDRLRKAEKFDVKPVAPRSEEIRPMERTRLNSEIANRLDGRPMPDRKTLLKLTLETAKDLARRR